MIIYLAQLDSRQPVDAAVTTLEEAQRVVEELAREYRALPQDVRWKHLASRGYPTCWSYVGSHGPGGEDSYGSVQRIEVTPTVDLVQGGAISGREE